MNQTIVQSINHSNNQPTNCEN